MNPSLTLLLAGLQTLLLLTLPSLLLSSEQHEPHHCADDGAVSPSDRTCATAVVPPEEVSENGVDDDDDPPSRPNRRRELPNDFVDPCRDENPNCPKWAGEGECVANPGFMLVSCARSCASCSSATTGGVEEEAVSSCVDEFDQCNLWSQGAECWVNPLFMQHRCKYSCWKCVNSERDRQLGIDEHLTTKKKLFANADTGKHQLLPKLNDPYDGSLKDGVNPMTNEDFQRLGSTVRAMDRYARLEMTDPSTPPKARERCRNEFRMCAEWASRGMCLPPYLPTRGDDATDDGGVSTEHRAIPEDVLFMRNACPLACRACGDLESFHGCAGRRHPEARPSFRPGELRPFFEGGIVSSEWREFDPLLASRPDETAEDDGGRNDPYVVVLRNFLSEEETDRLQSMGSAVGWTTQSASDSSSRNPLHTESARCHDNNQCKNDDIYQRIMHRISSLTNSTTSHLEPMEIFHSHSGDDTQYKSARRHNFEVNSLWKPAGPRVLSLFLFLSNAGDGGGGELGFPYLDWLHVRPKKGMAVLWSNVRNDNLLESDPATTFEHFPVRKGDESVLGAYVHVRLHNWTDANLRGCA